MDPDIEKNNHAITNLNDLLMVASSESLKIQEENREKEKAPSSSQKLLNTRSLNRQLRP